MSVLFSLNIKEFYKPRVSPSDAGIPETGFSLKGDNGSTVVLIHGLTGTPNEVRFIANALHKDGYSVICPRLANHGAPVRILKYSRWQDFYGSVRDIFLKGKLAGNTGPVFTSGLSMGALLALLAADEFKERVAGVSCLAPTLFYDGWNAPDSKFFLPLGYHTFLKYLFYFKEEPPYGIKNETIQQRIHKYYADAKLEETANVAQYGYPYFPVALLCQLKFLVRHLSAKLPGMRFPVQLIQAKDDDMTSTANSKFIYDRISSETKEMIFLYNSYHVITADQERDVVAEKMRQFFGRIRRPARSG
jgi:carboxylesterase